MLNVELSKKRITFAVETMRKRTHGKQIIYIYIYICLHGSKEKK